ncbi:hypothetical protein [Sinomicrobium sp. M5D2P9]
MNLTESRETSYVLRLHTEPGIRGYEAWIKTRIKKGEHSFFSGIKTAYSLECKGYFNTEMLRYRLKCEKQTPVDSRGFPVKKVSKAMQIALQLASVNNDLTFQVSPGLKILRLENTAEVREKWNRIKPDLEKRYPDLKEYIADYEWQLKEDNIQRCYTEDTFYRFLFPDIFDKAHSEYFTTNREFVLHDAVEGLSLPVLWQGKLKDFYRILDTGKLEFRGKLQTDHPKFPGKKLNLLVGSLADEGSQHALSFDYSGHYDLKPKSGRIEGGEVKTLVTIGDIYRKETETRLKLLRDER